MHSVDDLVVCLGDFMWANMLMESKVFTKDITEVMKNRTIATGVMYGERIMHMKHIV